MIHWAECLCVNSGNLWNTKHFQLSPESEPTGGKAFILMTKYWQRTRGAGGGGGGQVAAAVQPQPKIVMRGTCKDSWRNLMVCVEMGGLEWVWIWSQCISVWKTTVTSWCDLSLIEHTVSSVSSIWPVTFYFSRNTQLVTALKQVCRVFDQRKSAGWRFDQTRSSDVFTFLCRLHVGGENGESLESPLLTEAELGVDAEAEGILHSTSDAQLPSLFTRFKHGTPVILLQNEFKRLPTRA